MRIGVALGLTVLCGSLLAGCASGGAPAARFAATGDPAPAAMAVAADSSYGYTEANPIRVGGGFGQGARNEHAYLAALHGPDGEAVSFRRLGSCCGFRTRNAPIDDTGLLDVYEVTVAGRADPVTLYLDMYDYEAPRLPLGFSRAP